MITKKICYIYPIKKNISNYKYDDYSSFELLPSLYNGNIKVPVTIDGDTIYLTSILHYGDISVRFIGYDMNGISQGLLERKLNDNNFISSFYNDFSVICFSRIYPVTILMKAFINAYYACIKYYECLYTQLDRTGIYPIDHDLIFFVNIDMTNSFWYDRYIFFGNGSGDITPLTSVDICAHELTHGLIDNTIYLEYQGESGALNESIADMFGVYVEFYINSSYDTPDWTIGEQVDKKKYQVAGFRNFEDPLSKQQPDSYMGRYWVNPNNISVDNGGVHINSGVINFFCYICSNGKENYTTSLGYKVNIQKISAVSFDLDDFIKIVYTMMINEQPYSIRTFKDFGEGFMKYLKQLDYSQTTQEYINKCLDATRILSSMPLNSSTCCAI